MKIKIKNADYEKVVGLKPEKRLRPKRPSMFIRTLLRVASAKELKDVNFSIKKERMDLVDKNQPCLFLMNHSSFIDLKIAATVLYPRAFNIVCTSDGFVGKRGLLRALGCIPTNKFVSDPLLVKDILYCFKKLKTSVLMYPETSYSFDGTATPLPASVGKLLKKSGVPVVMIATQGAFLRDPLYNNLQKRKVNVSATVKLLWTKEELENASAEELTEGLEKVFSFDNFKKQYEENLCVSEPFRADGLNRVLYKCPECGCEGSTIGKGTEIKCTACGKEYVLTENGTLSAKEGKTSFKFVSDWYAWERECVRNEIISGTYGLNVKVKICILNGTKTLYRVGDGVLCHNADGFTLTGCDGKLYYTQPPEASYSLYADYYWYEIGDVLCIGDNKILYYCFPYDCGDVVAKTRLAAEETYKLKNNG